MKDKIVFFILGALLATLAYFAGDVNLSAVDHDIESFDTLVVEKLIVGKTLSVGLENFNVQPGTADPHVIMSANDDRAFISIARDIGSPTLPPHQRKVIFVAIDKDKGSPFIVLSDGKGEIREIAIE